MRAPRNCWNLQTKSPAPPMLGVRGIYAVVHSSARRGWPGGAGTNQSYACVTLGNWTVSSFKFVVILKFDCVR